MGGVVGVVPRSRGGAERGGGQGRWSGGGGGGKGKLRTSFSFFLLGARGREKL